MGEIATESNRRLWENTSIKIKKVPAVYNDPWSFIYAKLIGVSGLMGWRRKKIFELGFDFGLFLDSHMGNQVALYFYDETFSRELGKWIGQRVNEELKKEGCTKKIRWLVSKKY